MTSRSRRRFIQGSLGLALPFLAPATPSWAQSEGATRLLRLPKVALVIGNCRYTHAQVLRNPANDASAMAETLREAGFEVALRLEATRAEMAEAFQAHARALASKKAVGLVYYAGHGLQLAWRNYLVPVDARIERIEDIPARCVEVGALLDLIGKSGSAMNVIILDACRENPFSAADFRLAQAGLSQMDAPPATLLAYATAPGNGASDGAGANGLYTANLLREMKVRDAKIEDVFKRVRLNVRRDSKGAQIPWESTSLEEDFYFVPPAELKKLSEEEAEQRYREELEVFERARASKAVQPLEEYLRRYPSGRFTELAQLQLNTALAAGGERPVEIVSPRENPNTKGYVRADTRFRIGDEYVLRFANSKPHGRTNTSVQVVTAITDDEVVFSNGVYICDLLGNTRKSPDGRRFSPRQELPLEYAVGRRWHTRFSVTSKDGEEPVEMELRIVGREKVTVPAGTFDCFRIEGVGLTTKRAGSPVDTFFTQWRAPEVRRNIATEERRRRTIKGHITEFYSERRELISFKQQD